MKIEVGQIWEYSGIGVEVYRIYQIREDVCSLAAVSDKIPNPREGYWTPGDIVKSYGGGGWVEVCKIRL